MTPATDLQVFYAGKVQGVGFRYSVKALAAGYEVVGGVQNLADGRVELRVSGPSVEVQAFLEAIERGQLRSFIQRVEQNSWTLAADEKTGFAIWR